MVQTRVVGLLALFAAAPAWAQVPAASQPAAPPAGVADISRVGAPAPPLRTGTWLNGKPLDLQGQTEPRVIVLLFWATWSGPTRMVLPELVELHERFVRQGVAIAAVTDEPLDEVRRFLDEFKPALPFRIALDEEGATQAAYCAAAGVNFVPYAFVIGPDRRIAWHGHPGQPELVQFIEQLLRGTYDVSAAREAVQRARSAEQLEAVFREACDEGQWNTALLALDGLLQNGAPADRILRYKLTILLDELEDVDAARRLADEALRERASNVRLLNSLAWDIVGERRLFERDPELGLRLARAAHHAEPHDSAAADTYARALYLVGRLDLAITTQEKAVNAAPVTQRGEFQGRLDFYRRCQALSQSATLP